MIKFEVGKVYKRLDRVQNIGEVVVSRNNDLIRTLMVFDYLDFEKKYSNTWRISVIDDIEKIVVGDIIFLSANMPFYSETEKDEELEVNIEEVKEEDKEGDSDDWVVGKEYEAISIKTKQRFKVKLTHRNEGYNYPLTFDSVVSSLNYSDIFEDCKDIAFAYDGGDEVVVVFKHGIKSILDWEEAKEKPREPVHFRVGNTYKGFNDEMFVCQTTFITTNSEKVGVFYNSKKDAILAQKIYSKNNVEYTYFMKTDQLDFIADEQYRDEIKALL